MIDHIVYVASDLDKGISEIEQQLGVRAVYGGRHLNQGTHNALIGLGDSVYFEILAPDPDNKKIIDHRWMGVDLPGESAITRWALKSANIAKDAQRLSVYHDDYAVLSSGERQTADGKLLRWELTVPQPAPRIEIIPFLIDWTGATHPADNLPHQCSIESLVLSHPSSEKRNFVNDFTSDNIAVLPSAQPAIQLMLHSPKGLVTIQ